MFDLPNDVIVTMVAANAGAIALNIRDSLGDRTLEIPLSIANPNTLALGDLTGDGYDELVISYIEDGLQVASASDVIDFEQGLVVRVMFRPPT
jgi:hypothetical protein